MDLITRFNFILSDEKVKIKGFLGQVTNLVFTKLLGDYGFDAASSQYSLDPIRRQNSQEISFSVYTTDQNLRGVVLSLLTDESPKKLSLFQQEIPLSRISVETISIPQPKITKKGSSLRIRFLSPTVLNTKHPLPQMRELYRQFITQYSQYSSTEIDIDAFTESALKSISTPDFDIKSGNFKHMSSKVLGFRGSILLVVEKADAPDLLYPSLELASALGLGLFTSSGFGRMSVTSRSAGQ